MPVTESFRPADLIEDPQFVEVINNQLALLYGVACETQLDPRSLPVGRAALSLDELLLDNARSQLYQSDQLQRGVIDLSKRTGSVGASEERTLTRRSVDKALAGLIGLLVAGGIGSFLTPNKASAAPNQTNDIQIGDGDFQLAENGLHVPTRYEGDSLELTQDAIDRKFAAWATYLGGVLPGYTIDGIPGSQYKPGTRMLFGHHHLPSVFGTIDNNEVGDTFIYTPSDGSFTPEKWTVVTKEVLDLTTATKRVNDDVQFAKAEGLAVTCNDRNLNRVVFECDVEQTYAWIKDFYHRFRSGVAAANDSRFAEPKPIIPIIA